MSAASFLGISGLIALFGYDGMLYSVGFLVAWLVVLFLVAELVRNCGRFTLADVVAARMRERPVRIAAGTSSVTVSVLYLVAQMVGAGSLVALLLGGTERGRPGLDRGRRRRAHGRLRVARRDARHHLDPDREGGAADGRRRSPSPCSSWCASTATSTACCTPPPNAAATATAFLAPGLKLRRRLDRALRLHQPRTRPGPRHGGAAAHPVALLHRAHRARRPPVRGLVDRPHRRLLPDDDRAGLRRGRPGRLRTPCAPRNAAGQHGGAAARARPGRRRGLHRRNGSLRGRRRRRLRHDPRRRRRDHPRLLGVRRPRPVRLAAPPRRRSRAARSPWRASPPSASAWSRSRSACSPSDLNVAFLVGLAFAVAASANLPVLLYSLFWRASPPAARSGRSTAA